MINGRVRRLGVFGTAALVLSAAGCMSSSRFGTGSTARRAVPNPSGTSTSSTDTTSTTEGQPVLNPPTTTVTYPNPYQPPYNTISELLLDASFVVLATLGPPGSDSVQGQYYPLQVDRTLAGGNARFLMYLHPSEITAAGLTVGKEYLIFFGIDRSDTCVVGGVRGVFAYDSMTQTITRLDRNQDSQIPISQTLGQLTPQLSVDLGPTPAPPPPVCSPSATGL